MDRRYTMEERKAAVAKFRRTKSVTKTVCNLGYPGSWPLHEWIRGPLKGGRKPKNQPKTLRRYPWAVSWKKSNCLAQDCAPGNSRTVAFEEPYECLCLGPGLP